MASVHHLKDSDLLIALENKNQLLSPSHGPRAINKVSALKSSWKPTTYSDIWYSRLQNQTSQRRWRIPLDIKEGNNSSRDKINMNS